jgi:hypothetical protein
MCDGEGTRCVGTDTRIGTCTGMCADMCIDMCNGMCTESRVMCSGASGGDGGVAEAWGGDVGRRCGASGSLSLLSLAESDFETGGMMALCKGASVGT